MYFKPYVMLELNPIEYRRKKGQRKMKNLVRKPIRL